MNRQLDTVLTVRQKAPRGRWFAARSSLAAAVVAISGFAFAACGSSPPPTTTTTVNVQAQARAAIKANWIEFFSGKTSATKKIALVENGSQFSAIIRGQSSSSLAKSVTATVARVTLQSSTKATVRYSLSVGGQPALANQTGQAVLQGGVWKVGVKSFCSLLALEQVNTPACS